MDNIPTQKPAEMTPQEQAEIRQVLMDTLAAAKDSRTKSEIVQNAFIAGEIGVDELDDFLQVFGVAEAVAITGHEQATRRALGRTADRWKVGGVRWLSL